MKQSEIKELATDELVERIAEESSALERKKIEHAITEIENPIEIRDRRKTVARLKTELRSRQIAAAKTEK